MVAHRCELVMSGILAGLDSKEKRSKRFSKVKIRLFFFSQMLPFYQMVSFDFTHLGSFCVI